MIFVRFVYMQQVQQVQQVQQMGHIQHVQLHHLPIQQQATQAVQTLADVAASQSGTVVTTTLPQAPQATPVSIEMNSEAAAHGVATLAEATLAEGTHIMLSSTGETMGTISNVNDGTTQGMRIKP